MSSEHVEEAQGGEYWETAPQLPPEVFTVWRKPNQALDPAAIVATVDPDGAPHVAPFGSVRAITPRLLRLVSWRGHDTYANLCRDDRVMISLLAPSNIAVSVRGRAKVVRERMNADENYAVVEIDVEEVKNDMVRSVVIESGVMLSAVDQWRDWFKAVLSEVERM